MAGLSEAGYRKRRSLSAVAPVNRGGKLLIPAFSLGRTQTIVFFLHQLIHDGRLKAMTICFPLFKMANLAI